MAARSRPDRRSTRDTLAALVASPATPILELVGGWRGVFDAVGPNLMFLTVYLIGENLVQSTLSALVISVLLLLERLVARQMVWPAIGGMVLVALSGLIALMGGDGGDVFLPDLIQTGVISAVLLFTIVIRRPLLGMILGPLVSGTTWRNTRALLRGYDMATALSAAAAVFRTVSKLPFYYTDNVVALGIMKVVTGTPLTMVIVYCQIRILRSAYTAAGATISATPDRPPEPPATASDISSPADTPSSSPSRPLTNAWKRTPAVEISTATRLKDCAACAARGSSCADPTRCTPTDQLQKE
ncbi:MAG: DUF3159 domain-containing protein [Mycobacterium sp.]